MKGHTKASRFHCTNPNCSKTFSRPKIIKYYVCPSCQTLIDTPSQKIFLESISEEKILTSRKTRKTSSDNNEKIIEETKNPEEETVSNGEHVATEETEPAETQLTTTLPLVDLETPLNEENILDQPIETNQSQAETEEVKEVPHDLIEEQPLPNEQKEDLNMSELECVRYFGYLGERGKGEGIPDKCYECSKSIDCMLSEYNSSKESVEAIKKWYPSS